MADGQQASGESVPRNDPETFREHTASDAESTDDGDGGSRESVPRNDPPPGAASLTVPERETFGLRGWVLVGVLVLSFLVVPTVIVFVPPAALPFEVAFLLLPLLPALLLGAVAVWSVLAGS